MARLVEELAIFPTRVWLFDLDEVGELNADLASWVETTSRSEPTTARGERQAWQSDNGFFDRGPVHASLRDRLVDALVQLHPSLAHAPGLHILGWANRLGHGEAFSPHTHAGSAWSGVYWVDAGESSPSLGGMLMLRDPRVGADMVESPVRYFDRAATFQVQPRTGRLVVFPSWLLHWVSVYDSAVPRISVAFNAW